MNWSLLDAKAGETPASLTRSFKLRIDLSSTVHIRATMTHGLDDVLLNRAH